MANAAKRSRGGAKVRTTARKAAANQALPGPWWLAGGQEECPNCGQRYAFEAEVRCAGCDGAICAVCVAWVERRAHCPGCRE
jgi:hypothetical protein